MRKLTPILGETAAVFISQGLIQLTTGAAGATLGGMQGAQWATAVDVNNRQLHPLEAYRIKQKAAVFADKYGISPELAEARLSQQVLRNSDTNHEKRLGPDDAQAQSFLKDNGLGKEMVDPSTGERFQMFTADAATRDDHAMFAQYAKRDATTRDELDRAYDPAFKPAGAPTIQGLSGSYAGALSGSDIALNDAARSRSSMLSEPPKVQWATLNQLRQSRFENQEKLKGVNQALETMVLSPANAERVTQLNKQKDALMFRDQFLLGAVRGQLENMSWSGSGLLVPGNYREWTEGMGMIAGAKVGSVTPGRISNGVSDIKEGVSKGLERVKAELGSGKAAQAEADALSAAKVEINANTDASFAGGVPVRPRDGQVPAGTAQVDTPIAKHLIEAEIKNYKGQPAAISGGHNMDNFNQALQANGGKVIGTQKEVASGIYQVEYRLPGTVGKNEFKTVYDPAKYSDQQMASMANEAVGRGIYQWNKSGMDKVPDVQFVDVGGVRFEVPISSFKGKVYAPTAFPSGR